MNPEELKLPLPQASGDIPYIPEQSPFTPEQRAYLNGFFAGLFSRTSVPGGQSGTVKENRKLCPLTVLFASQTGNTEGLAKKTAAEASKRGFVPTVIDLAEYPIDKLKEERKVLLLTSTYGDGEPPDSAKVFWDSLAAETAPPLKEMEFSILGLGDSNYPKFCQCSKNIDLRFESLGGKRISPRVDCDVDFEEPFHQWLDQALKSMSGPESEGVEVMEKGSGAPARESSHRFSKSNPFPAVLAVNRKLNGEGSIKDTRHFEISIESSGMEYEAGDALGVVPANCPELVQEVINFLGYSGSEDVPLPSKKTTVSIQQALQREFDISRIPKKLIEFISEKSEDKKLKELLAPTSNGHLDKYLFGRGVVDVLDEHPDVKIDPQTFVSLLRPLQPRLYSISSSPKISPSRIHLTVAVVRYASHGRNRKGVCSTFLAERVLGDVQVPVFVHTNKAFRMPSNPDSPLIMVGPGTGIAPFRAFLQERMALGAKGKNWLFFGDQKSQVDFLYREELEEWKKDGVLTRLDTAFSRDQDHKIYVQDRMRERADELYLWLEEGGSFYVCGDANRMAKDVDLALHHVIEKAGGLSSEKAAEYVKKLKSEKRYLRDVY